jgi:hypothetical protein
MCFHLGTVIIKFKPNGRSHRQRPEWNKPPIKPHSTIPPHPFLPLLKKKRRSKRKPNNISKARDGAAVRPSHVNVKDKKGIRLCLVLHFPPPPREVMVSLDCLGAMPLTKRGWR